MQKIRIKRRLNKKTSNRFHKERNLCFSIFQPAGGGRGGQTKN
jgi:hypothetical protein